MGGFFPVTTHKTVSALRCQYNLTLRQVLEAIWGEDMEDRGRLRGLPKTAFQVNAKAALIQRKDDGQKVPSLSVPSVTLLVSFMRGYPRVPPELR